MLIDTHCHLEMLGDEREIDEIIGRARENGIGMMVTIGTDFPSSEKAGELAGKYPDVYATVGIHPHEAQTVSSGTVSRLKQLIHRNPKIRGVGETGLDFYYEHSPRDHQKKIFAEHIRLARETRLPLVVHSRRAPEETLGILKEERAEEIGGIIHCFTENLEMAREALQLNFFISFSGIITFANAQELRGVVAQIPMDRILVETDAPFLSPVPFRGKKNEPTWVRHVAEKIAEIKNLSFDDVVAATSKNARRVFQIPN